MDTILLIELVEGKGLHETVLMPGAADIVMERERFETAIAGFMEFQGEQTAQDRPVLVDRAAVLFAVEEEATGFIITPDGHDIACGPELKPRRVVFFHFRDFVRREEFEELGWAQAGGLDDSYHVPWRGERYRFCTAAQALVASESDGFTTHGRMLRHLRMPRKRENHGLTCRDRI